ncbi:unnamed protein product [Leuciscus chuanchicus]
MHLQSILTSNCTHTGIKKKLVALSNKKDNRDLQGSIRSIINHFWFSCAACGGSTEQLTQRWTSLLHHVCGEHEWQEDGEKKRCFHAPLSLDDQLRKRWLQPNSQVFKGLQAIVMDKRLLKDLQQLTHFKHTGALEVFHNAMLKYLPKRLHFAYGTMDARTKLTGTKLLQRWQRAGSDCTRNSKIQSFI